MPKFLYVPYSSIIDVILLNELKKWLLTNIIVIITIWSQIFWWHKHDFKNYAEITKIPLNNIPQNIITYRLDTPIITLQWWIMKNSKDHRNLCFYKFVTVQ